MRKISRKQLIVGGVAAAVIAAGTGAAFAYWTTSGSGSTTASTTSGVSNTLDFSNNAITAMYPGDASQALTVTVTNHDASQKVQVSTVKAYLTVSQAAGAVGSCSSADYKLDGTAGTSSASPVTLAWTAHELAAGGGNASTAGTDSIQFNNLGSVQDGCKGATVTINYVAS
jgi:hypothetical protein